MFASSSAFNYFLLGATLTFAGHISQVHASDPGHGSSALEFIQGNVADAAPIGAETPTPSPSAPSSDPTDTTPPGGHWYQCAGGPGWTGPTVCASGSTCVAVSPPWYSQV